ncbi:hypothetical protein [Nitrobacter winogradskyi]|nr:hypothetical protein [Nitrobacter winogradskyi]
MRFPQAIHGQDTVAVFIVIASNILRREMRAENRYTLFFIPL